MTPRERLAWVIHQLAIAWVLIFGVLWLAAFSVLGGFGIDTRIYAAAARAWLAGGDPWAVNVAGIQFAAPPPSLLPFAALAWLPDGVLEPLIAGVGLVAVTIAIARFRVGWWWLLSVPVVEGVWVGSLDPVALALLGGPLWLAALAPIARLFTFAPLALLGRGRAIVVALVAIALSAPFLPWSTYLARLPELAGVLDAQSGGGKGALSVPLLIVPTVAALIAIGRRDGAWLAVPALWPASQLHYGILAIPVGSPILAAFAVSPIPAPLALGVIALALIRAIEGKLDPWSWLPTSWLSQAALSRRGALPAESPGPSAPEEPHEAQAEGGDEVQRR